MDEKVVVVVSLIIVVEVGVPVAFEGSPI